MARPRTLPDRSILETVMHIWLAEGERAVTFARTAERTGLSRAALVGRYGDLKGMLRAAGLAAWDRARTEARAAAAMDKGPTGFLKALDGEKAAALRRIGARDPALAAQAEEWRSEVETALAERLGGKGDGAAATLFAAWQGAALWGGEVRLKEAARRLS
jgi:AcrR family transcriptional regulator